MCVWIMTGSAAQAMGVQPALWIRPYEDRKVKGIGAKAPIRFARKYRHMRKVCFGPEFF